MAWWKDTTPKIFDLCKRKNWKVAQALHEDEWIRKLGVEATFYLEHLTQFVQLWALIQNLHLHEDVEDNITWKLTANVQYPMASAYKLKLFGLVESNMSKIMSKAWATLKVKNHACIALQNRLWRLIGWGDVVRIIVDFARFASKSEKPTTASSSIASSPLEIASS
jgi:hypothetical protein